MFRRSAVSYPRRARREYLEGTSDAGGRRCLGIGSFVGLHTHRQFGSRVRGNGTSKKSDHVFPLLKGPVVRPMLTELCALGLTVGPRGFDSGRGLCRAQLVRQTAVMIGDEIAKVT